MTCLKRSGSGLAVALAALLAVAAPSAWAGKPEALPEQAAERAAENTSEKPEKAAENAEKVEKAEGVEKAEKPAAAPLACSDQVFARVFKPFHDRRLYALAPGGDFETAAEGWTLEGPAVLAADSSPFLLGSALGVSSLELPAGATALSPPICVGRGFPSFRLVARSVSTDRAVLKVQVLYADGRRKATGRVKPGAEWAPTRTLSLAQGRFKTRRGKPAQIQLRFAAVAGTARLDDVYIDPRLRH